MKRKILRAFASAGGASETRIHLIGDGIENPHNARTIIEAAGMFGTQCYFRDRKRLRERTPGIEMIELEQMRSEYTTLIALENVEGAESVYTFRPPPRQRVA